MGDADTHKMLYAVNSGCYSSYIVDAIFDDRDMAEEYMRLFPAADYNDIEEYELNPVVPLTRQGYRAYRVRMARNGTVIKAEKEDGPPFTDVWFTGADMITNVMALSEEHAIKIANERRTMAIANNEWPTE